MKRYLLAAVLFLLVSTARADIFRLSITSADYNDGHYSVGLYHSTLQINENLAIPLLTTCIDFGSHVSFNQPFQVTVVNLSNFAGALHDNYWKAGWLTLQLAHTTDAATVSDIQRAIWLITTPGTSDPYLTTLASFTWANLAALNFTSLPEANVILFLRSGQEGQSQLTVVPEPGTYAILGMFGAGTISLLGFRRLFRCT